MALCWLDCECFFFALVANNGKVIGVGCIDSCISFRVFCSVAVAAAVVVDDVLSL